MKAYAVLKKTMNMDNELRDESCQETTFHKGLEYFHNSHKFVTWNKHKLRNSHIVLHSTMEQAKQDIIDKAGSLHGYVIREVEISI